MLARIQCLVLKIIKLIWYCFTLRNNNPDFQSIMVACTFFQNNDSKTKGDEPTYSKSKHIQ